MPTSPEILDVYLMGSKDKGGAAQMRLTTNLAARYRLSAPVVAEALEGAAPCRVAGSLSRRDAQALMAVLDSLGAIARCLPAGGAPGSLPAPGTPTPVVSTANLATPPRAKEGPQQRPHERPKAQPEAQPKPQPKPQQRPVNDALPPTRHDGRITLRSADVSLPAVVEVSEPIEFAEPGPEGKTGVRGPDTARCPIHGLVYNRRKASGCLRCLATARAHARKMQDESPIHARGNGAGGDDSLRDNPVRRAFWGLAIALLVGFVPAALYARGPNRRELVMLRAQQASLSAAAATKESLVRFDALDAAADQVHRRGAAWTLCIWLISGGVTGLVWTRLTRPSSIAPDLTASR